MIFGGASLAGGSAVRGSVDWLWGGLGLGAATLSTTFAAYMMIYGPLQPDPRPGMNLAGFAQSRPRTHGAWAGEAPPSTASGLPPSEGAPKPVAGSEPATEVDFTTTGTVPLGKNRNAETVLPVGQLVTPAASTPLPSFVLRDVFDGKALVESPRALSLVGPGTVLEGAGEVLSIERRGAGWVVLTTKGQIGG